MARRSRATKKSVPYFTAQPLLRRKFGELPDRLVKKIKALSLKRLEAFGEALLDFQSLEDVTVWLSPKTKTKKSAPKDIG